jgi:hypothetical protein
MDTELTAVHRDDPTKAQTMLREFRHDDGARPLTSRARWSIWPRIHPATML